jgi:cyclomaltodextrinase / maltogenic alpha-amylase / neopullulanase
MRRSAGQWVFRALLPLLLTFCLAGRCAEARPPDAVDEHPQWRSCTILYGVVPSLFGHDGFPAVTRHLQQISRLGVTALWLSPVTDAPPGDFGYALVDPFRIRPDLGSPAHLRALIRQAHAHGLRVLLDFVTNHLAKENPYFIDTTRFGRASRYFDWFERDPAGKPVHYFDWSSLENLNYGNAQVRHYMLAALTYWFRNYPIDGFRADAAWAVRERDPAFWPVVREKVERIRPGVLLVAEASARDSYYMSHGFDAAYDWTAELGHWAWQGVFGRPGQLPDLRQLRGALTNEGQGFPPGDAEGVVHFLNNNDTGERFISAHGARTTRLAAALLLTIPGIPLIYAGDEVGASFEPYAHPPPLSWNDPDHLLALYTRLIHLRREIPALRSPRLRLVHTSHEDSVLAYIREADEPEQTVTVVLNFGMSSFDLPLATLQAGKKPADSWWAEDLLSGTRTVAPPDAQSIRVAPRGALLLRHALPARLNSSCDSRSRD